MTKRNKTQELKLMLGNWSLNFVCFLFLASCFLIKKASAASKNIVISKIAAYGKSGYEWIEIVNRSNQPVDTSGWKFWENGTNHGWELAQGTDLVLDSSERAVIVQDKDKFLEQNPDYQGAIIDSAWGSLKESGEEIGIKDNNLEMVEVFSYIPCPDGTLERIDANLDDYSQLNWIEKRIETNLEQINTNSEYIQEGENVPDLPQERNESAISENPPLIHENLFINHPPVAIIGEDLEINAGEVVFFDGSDSFDEDNDKLEYFWDFGDGGEGEGAQVEHKYEHSGKFSAIMRVSDGILTASNAIWVNVVKIEYSKNIFINSFLPNPAGPDNNDEWIEICNVGAELVDLSGWFLDDIADGGSKECKIKETDIDADECLKFYRRETKIALNNDGDRVRLLNPSKGIADEIIYGKKIKDNEIIYKSQNPEFRINESSKQKEIGEAGSLPDISLAGRKEPEIKVKDSAAYQSANFQFSSQKNSALKLPIAILTADIYSETFAGESVKVAGTITDKSGNVFFVDDGSGAARVWISSKSKIKYSKFASGSKIIADGIVAKSKIGHKIIANKISLSE